jgi:ribose-phosphate pyrophosphokinase
VLSGGAVARIAASRLRELVITDSIQATEAVRVARNIRVMSIAPLIGEAIGRVAQETSVSSLFETETVSTVFAKPAMQTQKSPPLALPAQHMERSAG